MAGGGTPTTQEYLPIGTTLEVSALGQLGFDFADARPHKLAKDPPAPEEVFSFSTFFLFTGTAVALSVWGLPDSAWTSRALFPVLSSADATVGDCSPSFGFGCCACPCWGCGTSGTGSGCAPLVLDETVTPRPILGSCGATLPGSPFALRLTKEFVTPQNLRNI